MKVSLADLQRRLAELEEQAAEQTSVGIIFYDSVTGDTIVGTQDGRTFRREQAERLIAQETEPVLAIRGVSRDALSGRVTDSGGRMDEAIEMAKDERGVRTEDEAF
jgi:hypothetical protein